jgi:hypothetical protein
MARALPSARCFTLDRPRARVRQVFAPENVHATVRPTAMPPGTALDDDDGRWTRYNEGCAVLASGEPGPAPGMVTINAFIRL